MMRDDVGRDDHTKVRSDSPRDTPQHASVRENHLNAVASGIAAHSRPLAPAAAATAYQPDTGRTGGVSKTIPG